MKDWVWIWDSEKLLKSNKAATFCACNTGEGCTQTTLPLRYYCRFSHRAESTYWCISDLHSCICSSVWSSLATAAEHIYVKMFWSRQSSYGRGLKGWLWVWDSEQLIRSIETSMFYCNASNYHLIDVLTLTDTQHGHMVFDQNLRIHKFFPFQAHFLSNAPGLCCQSNAMSYRNIVFWYWMYCSTWEGKCGEHCGVPWL